MLASAFDGPEDGREEQPPWTRSADKTAARASNRIDYSLPQMGILPTGTNQNVFINGVSFGFEINR